YKGSVYFQRLNGHMFESIERGKSGAKIIDRDLQAVASHVVQNAHCEIDIEHCCAFGDFDFDHFWRNAVFVDCLDHFCNHIMTEKLARGEVVGNANIETLILPDT